MSPVLGAVIAGTITYLGRVARGKQMSMTVVVGIAALAIALAALEQIDRPLAQKFAVLIVIGTLFAHWEIIVEKTGLKG